MDVDSQLGGGRAALADAAGVSRSTVGRWLDGTTLPRVEQLRVIAAAVGAPLSEMLAAIGVAEDIVGDAPVRPLTREEVVAELGVTDPADQAVILAMVDRLKAHRAG
jgi:transcriptional regulator with XRE-family HTH domain